MSQDNSENETNIGDKMIEMLKQCEIYIQEQKILRQSLSDGFIFLKKSKVNGNSNLVCIDDIRDDIEPSVFCDSITSEDTSSNSDIYIFSAMPSPIIRKAQNKFRSSLSSALRMSNNARRILEITELIDKLKTFNTDVI